MAAIALTAQLLTLNTRGSDQPDAGSGEGAGGNGIVATDSNGWVVSPPSGYQFDERTIFRMTVTTAATITFKAGDRYPAQRADLGDLAITMATNDSRMIAVETGRFLQDDGTINVTCTQSTDALGCWVLPKAA